MKILVFIVSQLFVSMALAFPISMENLLTGSSTEFSPSRPATVVLFLSSTCPCSDGFVEHLNGLSKKYSNFKFVASVSNADENWADSKKYFVKKGLNFPVLKDEQQVMASKLKALKTPHVFVLGGQGEVLYSGGVANRRFYDDSTEFYLQQVLKEISEGKKPSFTHKRTMGCYIKRKSS